jgi:hypothetical protein
VETYNNGTLEGEYSSYHENGQLYTKYINNKKGKTSGDVQYYDKDGKVYCTFTFDEDRLKSARYFDKTGKQIAQSETSKGKLDLLGYNPDGTKRMLTPYNSKGEIDGLKVYYHGSGKNKETNPYTKGELTGESTSLRHRQRQSLGQAGAGSGGGRHRRAARALPRRGRGVRAGE